jgi:hypothetical protein
VAASTAPFASFGPAPSREVAAPSFASSPLASLASGADREESLLTSSLSSVAAVSALPPSRGQPAPASFVDASTDGGPIGPLSTALDELVS